MSTNIARGDEAGGSIRTTKRLEGWMPAMIVANKEERVPSRFATDPDGQSQGGSRIECGGNNEGRQYRGESWEWSARIIQCFQPFTMAVMWMYMIIMAVYQKQYRCCCWPQSERPKSEPNTKIQAGVTSVSGLTRSSRQSWS